MKSYSETYNRVAFQQEKLSEHACLWIPINESVPCDVDRALRVILRTYKMLGLRPQDIIGECFKITMLISMALLKENIKHTVTVGNVYINNKPYFRATSDTIQQDMIDGFVDGKPLDAHTWITLENGTVLDFTILSSINYKLGKKSLKPIESVYISCNTTKKIAHVPYFLGPAYQIRTCFESNGMSFKFVSDWLVSTDTVLSHASAYR